MATTGMASAASSFVLTSNVSTARISPRANRRLVVRAEGGGQPPAPPPPPSVGPKRGTQVKVLRRESYWYNGIGSVVTVDQDPKNQYPVVVRFNKVNYAGVSTNSYAFDEIKELK
ncbi:uncharacterized protein [Typha latifolia]|uniref:uncharacterized protein n=1 Tax=Typha latifolia TaxID=4733 RepID=UPI003C2B41D3